MSNIASTFYSDGRTHFVIDISIYCVYEDYATKVKPNKSSFLVIFMIQHNFIIIGKIDDYLSAKFWGFFL